MNPRAHAKHEALATHKAVKLRANRLDRIQLLKARKINSLEEAYRFQFENDEKTNRPDWYLKAQTQQVRSLRFATYNLYAEEFFKLDRQRTALEIEALKIEAATNTVHVRIVAHLIAKLIVWAKSHTANFVPPEIPPEPVPLEQHPTATPNSPSASN